MKLSSWIRPGAIVAWWQQSNLAFAVVAGEEKQRIRLIGERGREARVPATRVAFEVEPPGPVPGSTEEERRRAAERTAELIVRVRRHAEKVDVPLVWEVVTEGGSVGVGLNLSDLTGLAFERDDGERRAGLALALISEAIHFVRRGDCWEARDAAAVAELGRERETVARREEQRASAFSALRSIARGEEFSPSGSESERKIVEALEQLSIHEDLAPAAIRAVGMEALKESQLAFDRPAEGAFRLLRAMGRFESDDANLELLRHDVRTEFPAEVLEAAEAAGRRGFERCGRSDLTDLQTVTIDGPETREIDDALSAEQLSGGRVRLGIHIADPAAFVDPGGALDVEARLRATTHYLPQAPILMLPPRISQDAASLNAGLERPALSFLVLIDAEGRVLEQRVERSVIRSDARLDYQAADSTIESGSGEQAELLGRLSRVSASREELRRIEGAIQIQADEIDLHIDADGEISLERLSGSSAARRCVSEAMILAGAIGAERLGAGNLAAIYRRQGATEGLPAVPPGGFRDRLLIQRIRRSLKRSETSLQPGRHFALCLGGYCQVTSPLRRYQDLALHRQLITQLEGAPPCYDSDAMQQIAAVTEQMERVSRRVERVGREYWLLRYLERRVGKEIGALVVEREPRTVILLDEILWSRNMPSLGPIEPGTAIRLRIERVNARAGLLVLNRVA